MVKLYPKILTRQDKATTKQQQRSLLPVYVCSVKEHPHIKVKWCTYISCLKSNDTASHQANWVCSFTLQVVWGYRSPSGWLGMFFYILQEVLGTVPYSCNLTYVLLPYSVRAPTDAWFACHWRTRTKIYPLQVCPVHGIDSLNWLMRGVFTF